MKKKLTLKAAYALVEKKKHGGKIPKGEERTEPKAEKRAEIAQARKLMAQSVQMRKRK